MSGGISASDGGMKLEFHHSYNNIFDTNLHCHRNHNDGDDDSYDHHHNHDHDHHHHDADRQW